MTIMNRFPLIALTLSLAAAATLPSVAEAKATITIKNNDGPNEGFNDTTAVTPVGGNAGTTLGQQRLNVFKAAADVWSNLLNSNVEIVIRANFDPLTCSATSATLGAAGPTVYVASFPNAPLADTWYPIALGDKLAGQHLSATTAESISARFNSSIDTGCFTGVKWYYGLDGNAGTNIDLLIVLLHEFGHGLGFVGGTDPGSGAFLGQTTDANGNVTAPGHPSIWDSFMLDQTSGLHWTQMTDATRAASSTSGHLVWDGPWVRGAAPGILHSGPVMTIDLPSAVARQTLSQIADFSGPVPVSGVSAAVVLVNDPPDSGGAVGHFGCSAPTNSAGLAGKIALIDRSGCNFTVKVKNAQIAGAVGAIVADNMDEGLPNTMGGTDPTITIPAFSVMRDYGALLEAQLPGSVSATMRTVIRAGSDEAGNLYVFTPTTVSQGSSIYHFDISAVPNLLMEPFINSDLPLGVDLTIDQLKDIGWGIGDPAPPITGRRSLKRH
jgi:PA domain